MDRTGGGARALPGPPAGQPDAINLLRAAAVRVEREPLAVRGDVETLDRLVPRGHRHGVGDGHGSCRCDRHRPDVGGFRERRVCETCAVRREADTVGAEAGGEPHRRARYLPRRLQGDLIHGATAVATGDIEQRPPRRPRRADVERLFVGHPHGRSAGSRYHADDAPRNAGAISMPRREKKKIRRPSGAQKGHRTAPPWSRTTWIGVPPSTWRTTSPVPVV